ncbi:MAG: GGDEF domain-containing protein [Mycoplasmatota bacterium]|nr:GGDEF domain-containing protein [Mycoplasmatota bacterium]
MKKNNKLNKIIVLSIIGLILVLSLVIFILNYTKDSSSFSILEKTWINNHKNNVIDISVYNDVPIYGQDGEGIIFSYLEEFTKSYNIEFNKVPYLQSGNTNLLDVAFKVTDYNYQLTDNDILLSKDYYVIVGNEKNSLNSLEDLQDKNIGIFDNDISNARYFLSNIKNIKYTTCKDEEEIFTNLTNKEVDYIILPKNLYLDEILKRDLTISYHLYDIYKNYLITVNKDKTLRSILNKFTMIYLKEYEKDDYKTSFVNTFFKYRKLSEAEKMNYNSSNYVYGYVVNMPFENTVNKEFVGTISNYLSGFEDLVNVDFKMVGYPDVNSLKQAFSRGEVDLLFNNFNINGVNVDVLNTISPFKEDYVILSKENYVVNTIRSLKGKTVNVVANTYLYDYLGQNGINQLAFSNTDNLLRGVKNDSIIIMDLDTYEYYKDRKFKNFKVIYQDKLDKDYVFTIRDVNKNTTFYELFNYYVSSINYKEIKYQYNTSYMTNSKNELSIMFKYLLIILGSILLVGISVYLIIRSNRKKKEMNKEEKLKFIDVMTSLKNRNYLNYNIKSWEDNVIYPQAIVIIDLNNIKYINDNYGHAEGDEVIKKAASILIVNQEENTDIIRTDGNEFLIYMVGYDEKKVIEYTRRLSKEFKTLPHEFGATLGYSMITDNVKTIDDAINEATLSMRQAKEKL